MENDDPSYQISIEKFDDVSFEKDGEPRALIQLKHHNKPADLSDSSVDLWRTLNVWLDAISVDNSIIDHTDFLIITTASVPSDSVADSIQKRNYKDAFSRLMQTARDSVNKTNKEFYERFIHTEEGIALQLVERMRIISSADSIVEVEKRIQKLISYSCRPKHISMVLESIEGWWYQECVKALTSLNPIITNQQQLRDKLFEISRQYDDDNLPIEFWDIGEVEEATINPQDRIFIEQLRLLNYKNKTLRLAIKDYYRAYMQRSSWLRQGLLYVNELETYEKRLVDAWEHAYAQMGEELPEDADEQEKIEAGRALYKETMNQDNRIRPQVSEKYVMLGTYHILANRLSVGWRIDFVERLKQLLEGGHFNVLG